MTTTTIEQEEIYKQTIDFARGTAQYIKDQQKDKRTAFLPWMQDVYVIEVEEVWNQEPDKLEWDYKGFPCVVVRNDSLLLNGYVGLKRGDALYNASEKKLRNADFPIPYAVDYCGFGDGWYFRNEFDKNDNKLFWIGFTTGGAFSLNPFSYYALGRAMKNQKYANLETTKKYVEMIVDRLLEM